jgi:flavin reductase (DIM6/NTAB) family NADH-FMN oxidoreductase RutF
MTTKIQINPFRPVYPSPAALITSADAEGRPNIVTLGECFNVSIVRPVIIGIAIRTATHSHGLIRARGEFCVNLPTAAMLEKVDGIGSISGRDCDKFERFGLTAVPAQQVFPPLIAECPVNLECEVLSEHEVGDHQLFLGQVLVEHVDADVLGADGKPDPRKLDMLIYSANNYFAAGDHLGTHGLSRR